MSTLEDDAQEWLRAYLDIERISMGIDVLRARQEELLSLKSVAIMRESEARGTIEAKLAAIFDEGEWEAAQSILRDAVGRSQVTIDPDSVISISMLGEM